MAGEEADNLLIAVEGGKVALELFQLVLNQPEPSLVVLVDVSNDLEILPHAVHLVNQLLRGSPALRMKDAFLREG